MVQQNKLFKSENVCGLVIHGHILLWVLYYFALVQYFGHRMLRTDSLEKTLMLGKIEGRRRRGWERMRWHQWLNGHAFEQAPGVGDGKPGMLQSMGSQRVRRPERLNWTELVIMTCKFMKHSIFWGEGFPGSVWYVEDLGSVPGLGRSLEGRQCNLLRILAWIALAFWLRSSVEFLHGESPWTEEPGGRHSMGSQRVGHVWMTKLIHSGNKDFIFHKLALLISE